MEPQAMTWTNDGPAHWSYMHDQASMYYTYEFIANLCSLYSNLGVFIFLGMRDRWIPWTIELNWAL